MKQLRDTDLLLTNVKKVHMIGIGGSGMCPLAEILHSKGYIITGSDNNEGDFSELENTFRELDNDAATKAKSSLSELMTAAKERSPRQKRFGRSLKMNTKKEIT